MLAIYATARELDKRKQHTNTELLSALSALPTIPGRMQIVPNDASLHVYVDYAHTPDGLEKVLLALCPPHSTRKLWVVMGCGGEKDTTKRSRIGKLLVQYAGHALFTADNPRFEPLENIFAHMDAALNEKEKKKRTHATDRKAAIHHAILHASKGDSILLAGKGCEYYQDIQGTQYPHSDVREAQEALHTRVTQHTRRSVTSSSSKNIG